MVGVIKTPLDRKPKQICGRKPVATISLLFFLLHIAFNTLTSNKVVLSKGSDKTKRAEFHQSSPSAASSFEDHMDMYRVRYKYQPPSTKYSSHDADFCGSAPDFTKYFNKSMDDRSVNDEDKVIYSTFFKEDLDETNTSTNMVFKGSVVEMGAFNGVRESNSRFFDDCLDWETLRVEGNPGKYDELVSNRPHAHRFNYVPSCTNEEEVANKTVSFDKTIWTNAGLADGSVETAFTHDNVTKKVEVPCGDLTKVLLDIFPNGHVSFFSLDVEGSEPSIVRGLDFDRVYIEIIMIESWNNFCPEHKKCASRDEYRKIMREAGYIMFEKIIYKSDLFIHPLSKYLEMAKREGFLPTAGVS